VTAGHPHPAISPARKANALNAKFAKLKGKFR